ncbi:MAG: hypothetical protein HY860_04905 [Chlamydiales bacterium]|nr:hypothetical protein [Chlamydiales bacterium]
MGKNFLFGCVCFSYVVFSHLLGQEPSIVVPDAFMEVVRKGSNSSIVKNYLYKDKTGFSPSINIAVEKTTLSAFQYMKEVKGNYNNKAGYSMTEFPMLKTGSGKAYLLQIDKKQTFGDIRILQMILLQQETAYIITACALKKEFPQIEKDFLKTFSSFTLK